MYALMRSLPIWVMVIVLSVLTHHELIAGQKKPAWLENRPRNPLYYVGIGMAGKSPGSGDYRAIARDNALQNLASEITINIASELIVKLVEQAGIVQEEFQSQIRSSTTASLEGYELVDSWEDDSEYWVYYRLEKDVYAARREAAINKAKALSWDLLSRARENEARGDAAAAIALYVQALKSVENYITEPLEMAHGGTTLYLQNEIFTGLQGLINKISLVPVQGSVKARTGRPLAEPLALMSRFSDGSPVYNLPLRLWFVRGDGDFVSRISSNREGRAESKVIKIKSADPIQIVQAELEIGDDIVGQSAITKSILKGINLPGTKFILNVSSMLFYVDSREMHLGQNLDLKYVEPRLKNLLVEQGFSFSEDVSQADFLIRLEASSRKGAEVYNLFSSFVDLNISVINLATGDEVYKTSVDGIKGIQLDYEKASIEALKNAGKKLEEVLPDLLAKLQ